MYKIIWTDKKKNEAIQMLTKYFEKYGIGESIQQNDDAILEAVNLLVDIADDILIDNYGIIYEN
jgi:rRNA-processing protein FCF1